MLYGKYQFLCRFETDAVLPVFKGALFKRVFPFSFKHVACSFKQQSCDICPLKLKCIYTLIFDTQGPFKPPVGAKLIPAPYPFVIEPPMTSTIYFPKGSSFSFNLLLFGNINHCLPYFISAVERMGEVGIGKHPQKNKAGFILKAVRHENKMIYNAADKSLGPVGVLKRLIIPDIEDARTDTFRIRLTIRTPLRLTINKTFNVNLPFERFIKAMVARMSELLFHYGDGPPAMNYMNYIRRAKEVRTVESTFRWVDSERYPSMDENRLVVDAVTGNGVFEGKIGEFLPLIDFCMRVHIGELAGFGLGMIHAEMI